MKLLIKRNIKTEFPELAQNVDLGDENDWAEINDLRNYVGYVYAPYTIKYSELEILGDKKFKIKRSEIIQNADLGDETEFDGNFESLT